MNIKKMFEKLLIASVLLTALACSNDEIQDDILTNQDSLELPDNYDVKNLSASTAAVCGRTVDRNSLGSAPQGPNSRCRTSTLSRVSGNPGLLDCRVNFRGQHKLENGWYVYSISRGNKTNTNTAVRIERGFDNFSNPGSGKERKTQFNGRVRVMNLPNDFTYVCQMHGSGTIRGGSRNGLKHTSAIWLLRAERVANTTNRFRFRVEMSNGAIAGSNRPSPVRTTYTLGGQRVFGSNYRIQVRYGYRNGQYNGTIQINSEVYNLNNLHNYDFTTDAQYFRYGAYRAGKNMSPTSAFISRGQARIEWESGTSFCNGPVVNIP